MTAPALGTVDQLQRLAAGVLDLAADLLDDAGFPPPYQRYVAPGRVTTAPGCEALAVVVDRVALGTVGNEGRTPPRCLQPATATLTVTLHRCVPTVDDAGLLPDASEQTAAASALLAQGWVLLRGFQAVVGGQPGPGRLLGVAGPLEALRPEGGVGGWTLGLTVQVREEAAP